MSKREDLNKLIKQYELGVRYLEEATFEEVASLLVYRDSIAELLSNIGNQEDRERIANMDKELRRKRNLVAEDIRFLRKSGKPGSSWWWYLDKITEEERATA
ncbi:hypothetical protein HKBW3S06_01704 [Candidatus Hakubella thermalkaliphila]|uniref:Uncharacterized protein n=1 Tax=Candidatus Hakubella thermalkaliphila TaxID=2754717 RepID=A0A6V8NVG4_9ACTN|nr:hypothetical protein [Candidatus Hakubella thermalkaliphila]MBT9171019.1 hypothetical protein [Actinomycetota bacterium]GFP22476.1 hypothetical protein HKBW3S06_01704 [Candidatus Hakubella thermalkaliphila]GFP22638.1 hypothetical protein HKBW3S09_00106 [Candidatus Hakubella thermalkaliphila]GFP30790.1 hypothetical protein HKBW3S34_01710 [Candidatus Hakubella thermalkaliphila]GFP37239.1 hypothetical protein HKBW3S44_00919 [Candidatus Hakubella thermalkaliphila]